MPKRKKPWDPTPVAYKSTHPYHVVPNFWRHFFPRPYPYQFDREGLESWTYDPPPQGPEVPPTHDKAYVLSNELTILTLLDKHPVWPDLTPVQYGALGLVVAGHFYRRPRKFFRCSNLTASHRELAPLVEHYALERWRHNWYRLGPTGPRLYAWAYHHRRALRQYVAGEITGNWCHIQRTHFYPKNQRFVPIAAWDHNPFPFTHHVLNGHASHQTPTGRFNSNSLYFRFLLHVHQQRPHLEAFEDFFKANGIIKNTHAFASNYYYLGHAFGHLALDEREYRYLQPYLVPRGVQLKLKIFRDLELGPQDASST